MKSADYRHGSYLVLDFETTSLENGSPLVPENRLILACGLDCRGQRMHTFGGEMEQAALLRRIREYDFIIAQNAKFELGWLRRCGAELRDIQVFDTQIAQKVLAGNRSWPLSLDAIAAHYHLGTKQSFVSTLIKSGVDPSVISRKALLDYCRQDVHLTHEVFLAQRRCLDDGQLALLRTRCELTPVLADIEFYGLGVDHEAIQAEHSRLAQEMIRLNGELSEIAPGVLLTSNKQVGDFIYDTLGIPELKDSRGNPVRTPSGARSVSDDVLAKLQPPTAAGRKFLKLRGKYAELHSANAKYIKKLASVPGRAYARFNQTATKTDRLSSTGLPPANIQFQNMDRGYKRLFKPTAGYVYVEADAGQLEFRVAVALSGDTEGLKTIREHRDVHADTAAVIGGKKWEKMDPEQRQKFRATIKPHTFKPLYGGQSGTAHERAYYKWFRSHYSGIYTMQLGWVSAVVKAGKLRMPWGACYYFNAVPNREGYVPGQAQMFNYPIQAFATAEIIPVIVRGVWDALRGMKSRLVNTVHDSVLIEAVPDEVEKVKAILLDIFTRKVYALIKARYGYDFTVPLEVDINVGLRWGENTGV